MEKKSRLIIKIERFIAMENKGKDWNEITAKQLPNGNWLCEIELSKIGITVKATGKTEYKAMNSAALKADAVIGEFLHCNLNASATIDSIRNMGIEVGKNGEFVSTQLAKKQKERIGSYSKD